MQTLVSSLSRHVFQSKVENAMSEDATRDALAGSRFLKPVLDFFKRHIALAVLMLFAATGVWVLDDYGVALDTGAQRSITTRNLEYLLGRRDMAYPKEDFNRFYGVSFELPLALLERALGLDNTREIHLMRHLVTHLFFLTGGFFCYLLAYRLFESRLLALLAMLLFLLHPRIYAHSFFNSKDIPFLSMFMVCLYLTHRAFGNGNIWRFLILGIAVGISTNIRIMGLVLFFSVVALCMLDLFHSLDGRDRRRVLSAMSVFVLSVAATIYVVSPYLWGDPLIGFMEWFASFSQHPTSINQVFRGELVRSGFDDPVEYVPVWMSITTPPAVLVLGIAGTCLVLLRGLFRPRDVLANTRLRFWFMLVGCFVLPVVAVIVLSSNIYDGWRQMYFIYAPFCLLAVFGLHRLMSSCNGLRLSALSRVFQWEMLMYGVVATSIAAVVVAIVPLHPHHHLYFNFLLDRTTPGHLRSQYETDYWHILLHESYDYLLNKHPSASIHTLTSLPGGEVMNWEILAEADRERLFLGSIPYDFYITTYRSGKVSEGDRHYVTAPLVYSRVIYNNRIMDVAVSDLSMLDDGVATGYREIHRITTSKQPVVRSEWDIYIDGRSLIYVKEQCVAQDYNSAFFLQVSPDDIDDLPDYRRRAGHSTRNFDFDFGRHGVRFDGRCMVMVPLLEDGISGIRTGQWTFDGELWSVAINLRSGGESAYRTEYESVVRDDPMVSSEFDVYLHDGRMIYVREPCDASDTEAEFFLDIMPSDVEDLPPARMDSGFEHLRFIFETRGLMFDGMCVASIGLPDYDIKRVTTGQLIADDGTVSWDGGYNVSAAAELPVVVDELRDHRVEPVIRSYLDVYSDDDRLIYFRSDCADEEVEAPFFVHIYPADLDDLSHDRRSSGFESFSFGLLDQGVMSGDGCFTSFDLPDYDVAGFLTGQFQRDEGNLWEDGHSFVAAELPDVVERLRRRGAEPVIRSYFDVYSDDGRLVYVRDSCSVSDAAAKFFLHVMPLSVDDLPPSRVEYGFDNLGFVLETHGSMSDGMCVAGLEMPNYDIKRITTGQWDTESQHNLWKEEFSIADD